MNETNNYRNCNVFFNQKLLTLLKMKNNFKNGYKIRIIFERFFIFLTTIYTWMIHRPLQ